uniref:Uncharacterized protein n=1 Tax=Chenopodium quinoa TaxID=63459 RepID=A0A803M8C5_CHEQI
MVHVLEFDEGSRSYLSFVDQEDDNPKTGTRLQIRQSLRRPDSVQTNICKQNFRSDMSVEIANVSDNTKVYKLQDTLQSIPATDDLLPMLDRSIIEESVRWGSATLKMYGESCFIPGYRE